MNRRALFNRGDRDENEPKITEILDRYHVEYSKGMPGDGYDLLVQLSPMELWEVKNPEQPLNKQKLTEDEKAKQEYCRVHGIPYRVIKYPEQAANTIADSLRK